jgi:hypothetical protein
MHWLSSRASVSEATIATRPVLLDAVGFTRLEIVGVQPLRSIEVGDQHDMGVPFLRRTYRVYFGTCGLAV